MRVRIVVLVYAALAPDPAAARSAADALGRAAAAELADAGVEVVGSRTVDAEPGPAAGPEAVVLIPATATPPDWAVRTAPPGVPVVVWDTTVGHSLPAVADQAAAHRETSAVGTIMAGGGLAQAGRRFAVVAGGAAAVVDALRSFQEAPTRILRIGTPIPGYATMALAGDVLRAAGIELTEADPSTLEVDGDAADRSHQLVARLAELAGRAGADAVAVNCHGPLIRDSPAVGVTACLAASGATPTSCTADVPTAWLLARLVRLGHRPLYCEPYTVDDEREAVFLGNCGIGNAALARPGSWAELPSQYYPGVRGRGLTVAMAVRPGPATFVAVRPGPDRWQLVAVVGEILEDTVAGFGGAQAFFRPDSLTPRAMVSTLAGLGVVHHGALVLGDITPSLDGAAGPPHIYR